jgi:hypothetical protein
MIGMTELTLCNIPLQFWTLTEEKQPRRIIVCFQFALHLAGKEHPSIHSMA